jgi:RNA polymerase sigma factor (sigma-70 family)
MSDNDRDVVEVVLRAVAGDRGAWAELVRRHEARVRAVAIAHRLTDADTADVCQNTWLILAENLGGLRDPSKVSGWLATIARRESLRVLALRRREMLGQDIDDTVLGGEGACPETCAVTADRDRTLWTAVACLPTRCQRLLGLSAHAPELTYPQLGHELGIAAGSVGKTRARCLALLRRRLAAAGLRTAC